MGSLSRVIPTSKDRCHPTRSPGCAYPKRSFGSVVFLCLLFLSLALPAAGQTNQLLCPVTMPPTLCLWDDPSVWSLGVAPNGTTDIFLPAGFVSVDINASNGHVLDIAAPAHLITGSTIQFSNSGGSAFINNSGGFENNGVLFNAQSATLNNFNKLDNNGTISNQVSANFNNAVAATLNNNSGGFIINDMSSTITNNGKLVNKSGATLSNFGTFNGTGQIQNSGTIDNVVSGTLSQNILNLGGTINIGGGTVQLAGGSDIEGGTLNNVSGTLETSSFLFLEGNTGFGAVTLKGTLQALNDIHLAGTINNQATIMVGGPKPALLLNGATTLQGGGTVILSSGSGIGPSGPSPMLTNVDNTIQGAGTIGIDLVLVNGAAGIINANLAGQTLDLLLALPVTNMGLMEGTGGGGLVLDRTNINNTGGTIAANGGTVLLDTVTITGGTITAMNGGAVTLSQGGKFADPLTITGATLNNASGTILLQRGAIAVLDGSTGAGAMTIQGTYTSDFGSTTKVLGVINNQGNMQFNSSASGFDTHLTLAADTTLQGGGAVTLANPGGGTAFIDGTHVLTNVDNTIQGAGTIGDSVGFPTLINQAAGIINANVSGQVLSVNGVAVSNAGLMEATGGGTLLFINGVIANQGGTITANGGKLILQATTVTGGTISALGGGVTILSATVTRAATITALNGGTVLLGDTMSNADIVGGTLNNVSGNIAGGGQTVTLDGSTVLGAVTIQGTYTGGAFTHVLGTINNQGNMQVNGETQVTLGADTTLQGGGIVDLHGSGIFTPTINPAATGLTLTNVDNTIQGAGTIDGLNNGLQLVNQSGGTILANAPGQILLINGASLLNGGTVQVDAGSALQVLAPFIQTGGKTQVDGTLLAGLGENVSGGMVLGTGSIIGSVTLTGGTIQPGSLLAPGTLIINGNFTHSAALFNELIGIGGNGLLVINGASSLGLGSLLNIDLLGNFKPFLGETFTLMDFTSGSGFFANALPMTDFQMDGYNWSVEYGANSIILDAGAPVVTSTNVPEPNSLLLLSTGLAALAGSLWKKRAAQA